MALPGDSVAVAIGASGLTIYDDLSLQVELIYDIDVLEARLDAGLRGLDLGYPLRTRAKVAKAAVAELLGYPVPSSFRKTKPRFPGQDLDIAVQKADNFQPWNEDELDGLRRYALIRVDGADRVSAVRVLTGEAIALLDRTGTLTSKYQAKRRSGRTGSVLVTPTDTDAFVAVLSPSSSAGAAHLQSTSAAARPEVGRVLTIGTIYDALASLVGSSIEDPGLLQDRNRGAALQRLVCEILEIGTYADAGRFPDILSQALEVKLQMSPTIDLGLVTPDSVELAEELGFDLRHCDVRYAVVYGESKSGLEIVVTAIVVTTGEAFFDEFQRFEGLVRNKKRQIRLPQGLFEAKRSPD